MRTDFYFFNHGYTEDTVYLSNALLYGLYNFESHDVDFEVPGCNRSYKSSGGALIGSLVVGYQWMFDSGINIAAGLGGILTRNLSRTEEFKSECDLEKFKQEVDYEPYRGVWVDLTVGYAF